MMLVKGMLYAIGNVEYSLFKSSPTTILNIFQIIYTKNLSEFKLLSIEDSLQRDNNFCMFNAFPPTT